MQIPIRYGKDDIIDLSVPGKNLLGVFNPNPVAKFDETALIAKALANPINHKSFDEFIAGDEKIVIIVNDGTRPTPTAKILKQIYPKIRDKNKIFIIATGCHREGTLEEYEMIFGKEIYAEISAKGEVCDHDSKKDEMSYLGESKNGTQMYLNKIVAEAKKVIVIGSVEPHYFAGYTGGRKAFLPGVAKYETIEQNHKLALSADAQALRLEGNPVYEDMIDAMKVLAHIDVFSIQTVLDSEHGVYYASAGDLNDSFYDCVKKADEVFCVNIPRKADIVISVAPYPMDVDLYQAQKGCGRKNSHLAVWLYDCA